MFSSKAITKAEFNEMLARYSAVLEDISASKGGKSGQKPLVELDAYRYGEALELFDLDSPKREMDIDAIKQLVEWKLRHGKFRPTLMSLVSSNNSELVKKTVRDAITLYKGNGDIDKTVEALAKLRGIGPATASLLLTVHDPVKVVFFSDEAFYWLCCDGKKSPIKYNPKEYRQLRLRADELARRLDVSATDIEKVSYVLMKQAEVPSTSKDRDTKPIGSISASEKRKTGSDPDLARTEASGRRSKRTKA